MSQNIKWRVRIPSPSVKTKEQYSSICKALEATAHKPETFESTSGPLTYDFIFKTECGGGLDPGTFMGQIEQALVPLFKEITEYTIDLSFIEYGSTKWDESFHFEIFPATISNITSLVSGTLEEYFGDCAVESQVDNGIVTLHTATGDHVIIVAEKG